VTARRRPEKPLPKQVADFVTFHLADRQAFAAFTGPDRDAWLAFVYLVRLWGRTRSDDVAGALRAVVHAAQTRHADVMAVFKKSIPALLDWSDEPALWRQVGPRVPLTDVERASGKGDVLWPCRDGERVCGHERSRPYERGDEAGWRECRECGTIWKPTS